MGQLLDEVAAITGSVNTEETADALVEHFGPAARMLAAVLRNTTNPTGLESGYKHNVIPGEATANIDGRFLPGYEDEFFATLRGLLPDNVSYEMLVHDQALEDAVRGRHRRCDATSLLEEDPDATVLPFLFSGGTDAKAWDRLGIRCFGFAPLRLPPDLDFTALVPRHRRAGPGRRAGVQRAGARPLPRPRLSRLQCRSAGPARESTGPG